MKKNKGFSLIELLIAVTLLSIVMIMVTQFMGTTSTALVKTRRKLNIQNEAMEFGNQISDIMMQATYIRVGTKDGKAFKLDTSIQANKRRGRNKGTEIAIKGDLVVDGYPNYYNRTAPRDLDILMNESEHTLAGRDKTVSPVEIIYVPDVYSFRILTDGNDAGDPYYVEPKYIYMRYLNTKAGEDFADASDVTETYIIYYFTDDHKVYMSRGVITAPDNEKTDGYDKAVAEVSALAGDYAGLLSQNVEDCYFSADTEANTIYIDVMFDNTKYKNSSYNFKEAVVLRNTNVLTVQPYKMFLDKNTAAPTTTP